MISRQQYSVRDSVMVNSCPSVCLPASKKTPIFCRFLKGNVVIVTVVDEGTDINPSSQEVSNEGVNEKEKREAGP